MFKKKNSHTLNFCSCGKYKCFSPTGKIVNPCRDTDMDCRKDLHEIFSYFNKQIQSVLDQNKIATQQALESGVFRRSFVIPTANDSTCSNRIIHCLDKETKREKELLNRQNDFSSYSMTVEQKQALNMEGYPPICTPTTQCAEVSSTQLVFSFYPGLFDCSQNCRVKILS